MKYIILIVLIFTNSFSLQATENIYLKQLDVIKKNHAITLSQQFVETIKRGIPPTLFVTELQNFNLDSLVAQLNNDDIKKAFWINMYNGYTQYFLKDNPDAYKNRSSFFASKNIIIANQKFSLDDIEHGILRHSKIKWSMGYLNKLFPKKLEKILRVKALDYRIHFALNCGAKSCPPIAFYVPQKIDEQLTIATQLFLKNEVVFDSTKNEVLVPKLLSWFSKDFGAKKGKLNILKNFGIIPVSSNPKIKYSNYDWAIVLGNYAE